MAPSKGSKDQRKITRKKASRVQDCTMEGNSNMTVDDEAAPDKKKAPKKGTMRKSKEDKEEKIPPAVEKEVEAFVNVTTTLGVEGLRKQYNDLKNYIPQNYKFDSFTANGKLNRYADVVCLEDTRVKLAVEQPGDSDYIHANWVKLADHDRVYIAAQGPLEETIPDFWRMIWEHDVYCIVMLCKTVEEGKDRCSQYWPVKQGDFKTYGKIFVNNKKVENEDKFAMFTIEILPEGCSNSKIVKLIQFGAWPDRGTPLSGKTVLRLLRLITVQDKLATGNIVIHCSAGIGRTGTIILIDWVLQRLFRGLPVDFVYLFKELRNQRASGIQTEGQYLFVFGTILDYIKAKLPDKYKVICDKFHAEVKLLNLAQ